MLKQNEWWAVVHAHNGKPCCSNGQATLFETRARALTYKRARSRVVGEWNLRIRKVTVA